MSKLVERPWGRERLSRRLHTEHGAQHGDRPMTWAKSSQTLKWLNYPGTPVKKLFWRTYSLPTLEQETSQDTTVITSDASKKHGWVGHGRKDSRAHPANSLAWWHVLSYVIFKSELHIKYFKVLFYYNLLEFLIFKGFH